MDQTLHQRDSICHEQFFVPEFTDVELERAGDERSQYQGATPTFFTWVAGVCCDW